MVEKGRVFKILAKNCFAEVSGFEGSCMLYNKQNKNGKLGEMETIDRQEGDQSTTEEMKCLC